MTKHTPGPWSVGHDQRDWPRVYAGNCEIVRALSEHGTRRIPKEERDANRHLIAAAPDMLDALHDTARGIAELFTEKGQARRYAAAQALHVKRIRGILAAAIAKAEGRT